MESDLMAAAAVTTTVLGGSEGRVRRGKFWEKVNAYTRKAGEAEVSALFTPFLSLVVRIQLDLSALFEREAWRNRGNRVNSCTVYTRIFKWLKLLRCFKSVFRSLIFVDSTGKAGLASIRASMQKEICKAIAIKSQHVHDDRRRCYSVTACRATNKDANEHRV